MASIHLALDKTSAEHGVGNGLVFVQLLALFIGKDVDLGLDQVHQNKTKVVLGNHLPCVVDWKSVWSPRKWYPNLRQWPSKRQDEDEKVVQ